ncbi:MAG: hypothetical protein WC905_04765 [Patescibacteria group bacterium]|jgi:hypothetical protein
MKIKSIIRLIIAIAIVAAGFWAIASYLPVEFLKANGRSGVILFWASVSYVILSYALRGLRINIPWLVSLIVGIGYCLAAAIIGGGSALKLFDQEINVFNLILMVLAAMILILEGISQESAYREVKK